MAAKRATVSRVVKTGKEKKSQGVARAKDSWAMEIGARVKDVREHARLNQKEFGEAIGLERSTVTSMESGYQFPSLASLKNIAGKFRVSYEFLIEGKSSKAGDDAVLRKELERLKTNNQILTDYIELLKRGKK